MRNLNRKVLVYLKIKLALKHIIEKNIKSNIYSFTSQSQKCIVMNCNIVESIYREFNFNQNLWLTREVKRKGNTM